MACGEIGLSISDFYNLTPRQFYNISTGYYKKIRREVEDNWLQTKVISYFIYSSIPKKKGKSKGFKEFTDEFFNDKTKKSNPLENPLSAEERRERARQFFNKIDTQKNG